MAELVTKIKRDPLVLAQRIKCGYCYNPIAQGGDFKEFPIKGRKYVDGEKATGLMCEDCQAFPERIKEGPRLALREDENGNLIETPANNLPETTEEDELAVTATGMFVRRNAQGKLKKLDKDEEIEMSMSGTILTPTTNVTTTGPDNPPGSTRVETETRRATRRDK